MPSTRLSECVQKLATAFVDLRKEYEAANPGRQLIITCTHRSREEQFELYKCGRRQLPDGTWILDEDPKTSIVTQLDGQTRRSKHNSNPASALDFAVVIRGKVSWDPREYAVVGRLAEQRGLIWGGSWPHLKDFPHLEVPA